MTIERRAFMAGAIALGASACTALERNVLDPIKKIKIDPVERSLLDRPVAGLRMIEAAGDGMLGVEIFDTGSKQSLGNNQDRRFGHCSSFKTSLAAKLLAGNAAGELNAEKRVTWGEDDLLNYSPFTRERVADGATLRELAEATQTTSDNTAANLLLREVGGPVALTAFWRSVGDDISRLDRVEPMLNNVPIAEYRDTTTPAAMARTVAALIFGDAMPSEERQTLRQWMIDTSTGAKRVRAGLSPEWVAGDKTGTSLWPGMGSLYVDIGFVEPPDRAPITFATYFRARETHEQLDPQAEATLAKLGDVIRDFAIEDDGFPF